MGKALHDKRLPEGNVVTDFIISDLHIPFQNNTAIDIMLRMHRHFRPRNVIINGDALDFPQLSHFNHNPLTQESIDSCIDQLVTITGKLQRYSSITMIEGNHEARLRKFVNDRASPLYKYINLESIINSKLEQKIEYVPAINRESMLLWDDRILIGHFNRASRHSCYTAKLLVEQYMTNIIQSHTHRGGSYCVRGYNGILRGWENFCLCNLNPSYIAHPNWENGFLVYQRIGDIWTVESVFIEGDRAMFRGRMYK